MFNTIRSADAPVCLNTARYNTKEVVDILEPMFFGKCYLCEQDELSDPEIEHFHPHEGDDSRKFDWNNLYYSCGRCNSIKSNIHKDLLDCCDPNIDIFRAIKCLLPSYPDGLVTVEASVNFTDIKTYNTVKLIERCYNEKNTALRGITRSVLMEKLFGHFTAFLINRAAIIDKRSTGNERDHAKDKIKAMLRDDFPFSVFWKWHLINDELLSKKFEGEIDF